MGKSFLDKIIISDEEYERRKAEKLAMREAEKRKKMKQVVVQGNCITKFVNYVDSLFISEEEYQKRKKEKKEKKEEEKAKAKVKAYETEQVNKFTEQWVKTMAYIGLKNVMCETFALRNVKFEPYGFSCNIHVPNGMTLSELENEKTVNIIQDNLRCLFRIKRIPKSNHVEAKFITNDIPLIDFKPIKLAPYQLYMSTGIDGQPMIADMVKYPHILIQGSTGMGKTKFIDLMLANLITTETPEDVNLFIAQADKYEQITYRKCKHCKGYADDLTGIYTMLRYLLELVKEREEILKPLCEDYSYENINSYNKAIDKGELKGYKKWNYLYLVIDEYASLMPDGEFNKEVKQIKQIIQSMMDTILQKARATGLFVILSTQRATIDKMPSFVKAMCNTITTFKVNNRKSSEVAIDTGEAVMLKQREFITKTEAIEYGRTVNLSPQLLRKWITPYKVENKEFISFDMYNNLEEMLDSKKGSKKNKNSKKGRRENKKRQLEAELKASDPSIIKDNNDKVKTKTDFISTYEKEVSNLNKLENTPSSFLLDDWVDPLSDPNINIIDKTAFPSNTEKPKKENDNHVK